MDRVMVDRLLTRMQADRERRPQARTNEQTQKQAEKERAKHQVIMALRRASDRDSKNGVYWRTNQLRTAVSVWTQAGTLDGWPDDALKELRVWETRASEVATTDTLAEMQDCLSSFGGELVGLEMGVDTMRFRTSRKARKALFLCAKEHAWTLLRCGAVSGSPAPAERPAKKRARPPVDDDVADTGSPLESEDEVENC